MDAATRVKIMIGTATSAIVKKKNPIIPMVVRAIIETPVANPSKPSIKLTAFVIANIHINVMGKLKTPNCIFPINDRVKEMIKILRNVEMRTDLRGSWGSCLRSGSSGTV